MNYEEIKRLIDDMGNSKIDELSIEFPDGVKISMKKDKAPIVPASKMPVESVQYVTVPEKNEKTESKTKIREKLMEVNKVETL